MQCTDLYLIKGNRRIHLFNMENGIAVVNWIPQIPQPKGGGVFASSPFLPGRQLVMKVNDSVVETFELNISGKSANACRKYLQDMLDLLDDGITYWVSNAIVQEDAFAYLEVHLPFLDAPLYALVKDYRFPNEAGYMFQPFQSSVGKWSMSEISLLIERSEWLEDKVDGGLDSDMACKDGYYVDTAAGVIHHAYGPDAGYSVDSPWNREMISHGAHGMGFTDIYQWDNNPGAFSANLLNAYPYSMFPAVFDAADYIAFGITDTIYTVTAYEPRFCGLRIPITTTSGATWAVQFLDNAGVWQNFAEIDYWKNIVAGSYDFTAWFRPETTWQRRALNGVTGYWVRILSINGENATVVDNPWPSQQGYVQIPAQLDKKGVTSLQFELSNKATTTGQKRILVATRSQSRVRENIDLNYSEATKTVPAPDDYAWKTFSPWLCSPHQIDQMNANAPVAYDNDFTKYYFHTLLPSPVIFPTTMVTEPWPPMTFSISIGTGSTNLIVGYFHPGLYSGRFRAMLFMGHNYDPADVVRYRLKIATASQFGNPGSVLYTTKYITPKANGTIRDYELLDFGEITFPNFLDIYSNMNQYSSNYDYSITRLPPSITIEYDYVNTVGGGNAYFYGLYLLPVDEWWGDMYWPTSSTGSSAGNFFGTSASVTPLTVSGYKNPKTGTLAYVEDVLNIGFNLVVNQPGRLVVNSDMVTNLYALCLMYDDTDDTYLLDTPLGVMVENLKLLNMKDGLGE